MTSADVTPTVFAARSTVEGPAWCEPGLVPRAGRYPLAVEAPVMAAVDRLGYGSDFNEGSSVCRALSHPDLPPIDRHPA